MSYQESQLLPIKVGVSPLMREIITRSRLKRGGKQFVDDRLDHYMPRVDEHVRQKIYSLDPMLTAVWELQGTGEHRWHLYKHWTPGKTDEPTHFIILNDKSKYIPLDGRVVNLVEAALQERDQKKILESYLEEHDNKKRKDFESMQDEIRQWCRYYRRLFARYAWGTVGSLYERGIELPWMKGK